METSSGLFSPKVSIAGLDSKMKRIRREESFPVFDVFIVIGEGHETTSFLVESRGLKELEKLQEASIFWISDNRTMSITNPGLWEIAHWCSSFPF